VALVQRMAGGRLSLLDQVELLEGLRLRRVRLILERGEALVAEPLQFTDDLERVVEPLLGA
jgi:hypothetical protein